MTYLFFRKDWSN